MIVDHRTYTMAHGREAEYLALFEAEGLPVQIRHLGPPIAYFRTVVGPINQVVHLWRYDDFADMERRRATRDADPDWVAYKKKSAGMPTFQENKILTPTAFSSLR